MQLIQRISKYIPKFKKQKWTEPVLISCISFALACCEILPQVRPFALAALTCLYADRKRALYCVLGILLGACAADFSLQGIILGALPAVLCVPAFYVLRSRRLGKKRWRFGMISASSLLAILCVNADPYTIFAYLLSAAASCALLPILESCMNLLSSLRTRTSVSRMEITEISLLICALLAALPMQPVLGISPLLLLGSAYITLAAGAAGIGGGCAAAAALSALLLLKGTQAELISALCLSGLLAGLLRDIRRFGVSAGFLAGQLIAALALNRNVEAFVPWPTALIAVLPSILIPEEIKTRLSALCGALRAPSAAMKNDASRKMEDISEQIHGAAEVFNRLAQIFDNSTEAEPRARRIALCGHAASEVCTACERYNYCWKDRYSDTYNDFRELASMICTLGQISPQDVPAALKARCYSWVQILISMNRFNTESPQPEPVQSNNPMMARQCRSVADLMYRLTDGALTHARYDYELEHRIYEALSEEIAVEEVVCRTGENGIEQIKIVRRADQCRRGCTQSIRRILNENFNLGFICEDKHCAKSNALCSCIFTPIPRLKASCYAACCKKDGEAVCGDSFSLHCLKEGKYLAALSDGMGSGETAARESECAMALLETLLSGGVESETAYLLLNELLQMRRRPESYSTVDACVLDLNNGICQWGKIGAVPGYFMRDGKAQSIEGESLPAGIVEHIRPSITQKLIREGDVLVLVSDGVYDALCSGSGDGIGAYLSQNTACSAQELADGLMREALNAAGGRAGDDMTAVAVRIYA